MRLGGYPLVVLFLITTGCRSVDPAARFIARMDGAPAGERPKGWEHTKELMSRPAPVVGQLAPDFTLPSLNGEQTITRSAHQAGRPLVLIFASYT
jgi:hypothetical protein